MAATTEARRLTEAHRLAQLDVAAETVMAMNDAWRILDPLDLDGTTPRWLRPASQIISHHRNASAGISSNYLGAFKALETGVDSGLTLLLADPLPLEQLVTSMVVTGPAKVRQALAAGKSLDEAMELASATSSASAMRHALNGGRDTTIRTVEGDQHAVGWARVTSEKPCAFCAMLASRGPAYRGQGAAFRAHDRCRCSAEPIYRPDAAWPAGSRRWERLWQEAKAAGGDTTQEFRRLVEAA
jgi:hypothetical protein